MVPVTISEQVFRPSAVVPERVARLMIRWLDDNDVTSGGCWSHDAGSIQRFSGPFDGVAGMRGTAKLLGSLHITWEKYQVTIYRVRVTDDGVEAGFTVESLCDEVLASADLTLASCPRADLAPTPVPDPFKRSR